MPGEISELELIKRLERRILGMLAALDVDLIGPETARRIARLKQVVVDAKLDVRDYEMADSRIEMSQLAEEAISRMEQVRTALLAASEHGIFGAIDVAQLTVELEQIIVQMKPGLR